ncbi:HNH endonuclease [Mycobacterium phage Saguaro]|uniref:Uncharacterized protein n=1 Tax=Mycobacterium phage Saguaro TaxID=2315616 RepID=A0A386KBA3_9CAUD|nr:HNH endonuclease [Mycobacterium phage Saguaro]AYD82072.1 hypothetical protein SEA_SAGUARO_80 [Mycobacterium phage Saguaro]
MDPDAALRELRAIMALIKSHRRMTSEQLDHMVELFEGLDAWLSCGGFVPGPWRVGLAAAEIGGE